MNSSDKGTILFLIALIAVAVVLVDDVGVRVAMTLVPALLLAQRAMAVGREAEPLVGAAKHVPDRRSDYDARHDIGESLSHFREFYTTCHLFGQQRISASEAQERTAMLGKKLNQLLARLTSSAEAEANLV